MDELVHEFKMALGELRRKGDEAEAERKQFGEARAETKATLERIQERIDGLEAQIKRAPRISGDAPAGGKPGSAYKAAFIEWTRKGMSGLTPEQKTTLVGGGTTGDILVPTDLLPGVIRSVGVATPMRGLVTVRPTASDRLRKVALTEASVSWGSWENGEADPSFSDLAPTESYLYVEDLYGISKIGENELADNSVQLDSILTDSFGRGIGEAIDTAVIAGAGHGSNEPEGVLTASGITSVDTGQAGAITSSDAISLAYGVAAQYRGNGRYVCASSTEKALRLLTDGQGRFLWQPSLQQGTPNTFNGYEVVVQEDVPAIPASGTAGICMVFGDFQRGYMLLERAGMTVQRLNELYAEDGLVGFKAHARIGGGVIRSASFAKLNVISGS